MNRLLADLFTVTIDANTGADTPLPNPGVLKGSGKEYSVTVILSGIAFGFVCLAQLISDIWNSIFSAKETAPAPTPTVAKKERDNFLPLLANTNFMGGEKLINLLGGKTILAVERLAGSQMTEEDLKGLNLDTVKVNLEAIKAEALKNPTAGMDVPEEDAIACIETLMDQTIRTIAVWKNHFQGPSQEPVLVAAPDLKKEGIQASVNDFSCTLRGEIVGVEGGALKEDGTFEIQFPREMSGKLEEIKPVMRFGKQTGNTQVYAQLNSKAKGAKFTVPKELRGSIDYEDGKVTLEGNGIMVKKGWLPTFYVTEFHITNEFEFTFYKGTSFEVTITNKELGSIFRAIKWDQDVTQALEAVQQEEWVPNPFTPDSVSSE